MQAMILAAGFGTRLLPYTNLRPKPLFPILNSPLLLLTINRLQRFGFDHIVVNCHHLGDQIEKVLANIDGVIVQKEDTILGTGGGLKLAAKYFRDEPLLVTNGDIYHTIPYADLYELHLRNDSLVTLAMHDYKRFNTVSVNEGYVENFNKEDLSSQKLAFTGVHVIDPEILDGVEENSMSCVIDLYRKLLLQGEKIKMMRSDDYYCTDMGTVEDYLALNGDLISGKIPRWDELGQFDRGKNYCTKSVIPEDFSCTGWCVIGDGVKIQKNVHLEDVVVWDGAVIKENTRLSQQVIVES